MGAEDYRDYIEDLALAVQAAEEFEALGTGGTTSYDAYRAERLGPGG